MTGGCAMNKADGSFGCAWRFGERNFGDMSRRGGGGGFTTPPPPLTLRSPDGAAGMAGGSP